MNAKTIYKLVYCTIMMSSLYSIYCKITARNQLSLISILEIMLGLDDGTVEKKHNDDIPPSAVKGKISLAPPLRRNNSATMELINASGVANGWSSAILSDLLGMHNKTCYATITTDADSTNVIGRERKIP